MGDEWRSLIARGAAAVDKIRRRDESILEQYHLKGYAVEEIEVDDDVVAEEN